ncbi:AMP-binding protein [Pseudomonas aeruginosa]
MRPEHIAFLQYTSGSTALPKGVQVSHGNLVANEVLIRRGFGIGADDVIVSWLPLYHDDGPDRRPAATDLQRRTLRADVAALLPRTSGALAGSHQPVRRHRQRRSRISPTGCAASGSPSRPCSVSTLSGWRVASPVPEPIRQDSLERFAEKFAASRFDASSFFACYGLAEATLFVTGGQRGQGIPALAVDGESAGAQPHRRRRRQRADVLRPQPAEHAVLIVDAASGEVLGDDNVGEIWAAGPSIAHGYWRNLEASAKTFVERDGRTWLRTGDLASPRRRTVRHRAPEGDMLIVRGHNLYPQDIGTHRRERGAVGAQGQGRGLAVTVDGEEGIGIARRDRSRRPEIGAGPGADRPDPPGGGRGLPGSAGRWWRCSIPAPCRRRPAASCNVPPAACAWKTAAWTAMRCFPASRPCRRRSRRQATTNCWHASARSGRPGWAWRR